MANNTDHHRVFYACVPPRSYHFNDTANQNLPYEDAYPVFKLPGLALREVVNIQLDFINQSTTADNNQFKIELLDSSSNPIMSPPFGPLTSIPDAGTPYKTFFTAPFPGDFYLQVSAEEGITANYLQQYYLTVYKPSGEMIVKAVDVLRPASS